MSAPLEGVIVVALEAAVAAPFATRQLADLGARILKVERPGEGDFARHYDSAMGGTSAFFVWANRGKQSIELDLKDRGRSRPLRPAGGGRRRVRAESLAGRGPPGRHPRRPVAERPCPA